MLLLVKYIVAPFKLIFILITNESSGHLFIAEGDFNAKHFLWGSRIEILKIDYFIILFKQTGSQLCDQSVGQHKIAYVVGNIIIF